MYYYKVTGAILIIIGLSATAIYLLYDVGSTLFSGIALMSVILGFTNLGLAFAHTNVFPEESLLYTSPGKTLNKFAKFIIVLTITFIAIIVLLAFLNQNDFQIYFIADAVAFLIITLSFKFNSSAMSILRIINSFLFAGFIIIAIFRVIELI